MTTTPESILDLAKRDPMDPRVPAWLSVQAQAAQLVPRCVPKCDGEAGCDKLDQIIDQHHAMCDEIDHLRAESAAFRDLAGCCSDCEWEGVEIVHRPMCARWQSAEIAEVADRIANGHATCGATWRDTEATGWLWYCSLPVGHAGHHRCVGASW
jgi:hypothetical protein